MFFGVIQQSLVVIGGQAETEDGIVNYNDVWFKELDVDNKPIWNFLFNGQNNNISWPPIQIQGPGNILFGIGGQYGDYSLSNTLFIFNFTKKEVAGKSDDILEIKKQYYNEGQYFYKIG
jgi:hypothetical protein